VYGVECLRDRSVGVFAWTLLVKHRSILVSKGCRLGIEAKSGEIDTGI
jgi:hypothetical protein